MQGMRELLRGTLRGSLRAMTEEDRLAAAWPVACGRAMAERGAIRGFIDGELFVQISDPAWLSQMRSLRPVREHDLARSAGVSIRAIHFELKTTSSQ